MTHNEDILRLADAALNTGWKGTRWHPFDHLSARLENDSGQGEWKIVQELDGVAGESHGLDVIANMPALVHLDRVPLFCGDEVFERIIPHYLGSGHEITSLTLHSQRYTGIATYRENRNTKGKGYFSQSKGDFALNVTQSVVEWDVQFFTCDDGLRVLCPNSPKRPPSSSKGDQARSLKNDLLLNPYRKAVSTEKNVNVAPFPGYERLRKVAEELGAEWMDKGETRFSKGKRQSDKTATPIFPWNI